VYQKFKDNNKNIPLPAAPKKSRKELLPQTRMIVKNVSKDKYDKIFNISVCFLI